MDFSFSKSLLSGVLLSLTLTAPGHARTEESGEWFIAPLRFAEQENIEHRVCALETEPVMVCFEFIWQLGYQELWVHLHRPEHASYRFADGMASDFWVDGEIHGSMYMGKLTGSTTGRLDADRFLGGDRSQYYYYGETWLFFREVVAVPADYLANDLTLFHKLTHGQHLRLVHFLEGGETFETEYDLTGLAPLLTAAFEEAAAMEHKYGKRPAAE